MTEVAVAPPSYWSRERVEREVAKGLPQFLAETRLAPSPSFDATAPRAPLVPLAPEPWQPPAATVRNVAPKIAPRLPRAAAPSTQGSLL